MEEFIENYIDPIGKALMGEMWRDVYETFQDSLSLYLIYKIPSFLGQRVAHEDFSSYTQCIYVGDLWDVNRYLCYTVVTVAFIGVITLLGRIVGRLSKKIVETKKLKT